MAILRTARRQLRYPDGTQPANVPTDIQNLASDCDTFMPGISGTAASRPVPTAGPSSAVGVPGSLFYATDTGELAVSDGISWHTVIAAGEIRPTARAAAPLGWLMCDGAPLLRTDYPALFNALGGASSPYGLPDGTHFNLPDLRGRVPVGEDGAAGRMAANDTRGLGGGQEAATMPSHNHGGGNHSHSLAGIMLAANSSPHWAFATSTPGPDITFGSVLDSGTIITTQGSGNNMPPYQIVNYIIKT
jgi:microcystin-dependent protein